MEKGCNLLQKYLAKIVGKIYENLEICICTGFGVGAPEASEFI